MGAQDHGAINDAQYHREMRRYYAGLLVMGLNDSHPDDVDAIVSEWVQQRVTHGPQHDALGALNQDAAWWAETAPRVELQAYVKEGLRTLGAHALGPTMRKQMIARLWSGLGPADRAAFIERVSRGT